MGFLLHHSIDEAAQRHDRHVAFRCGSDELTYGDLSQRSSQVARLLREHGVGRGDRVGIHLTKSLELPTALYGILAAGAAYVPIDPAAPAERVHFLIRDCGIRHLVTDRARGRRLRPVLERLEREGDPLQLILGATEVVTTRNQTRCVPWAEIEHYDPRPPAIRLVDGDLAYIMVTSGSTGTPKGLMHTHRSGMAYARLSAREYGVTQRDRLGNHSPLHFDMSTFEYLTGPLCAATTVMIPEDVMMFPRSLAQLIEQERLTFWYSVPLALVQLLLYGELEQRDASSLRWVLFGGEPFPPKHLARLVELWPHARFSNSYGPAEVNQCTAYHLPLGAWDPDEPVPLGEVWPGAEGLIVDASDQPVAPGEVGELLIRSSTRMRGYWSRPDLNRKAFYKRHRFQDFEETFYRTGDLVRQREDGQLLFLGRRDRQVKVRGYRVELEEVESVLAGITGVAEAAVFVETTEDGESSIVGAVLIEPGSELDEQTLERQLAQKLPSYAVPERLERLDSLPRTGSGKIDRRSLARQLSRR